MEENKKFTFYEYIMFFMSKKHYLIIVPIITMVLTIGAVYFIKKDAPYTGVADVYTGSIDSKSLTTPDNLESQFKSIDKNIDISVPSPSNVKFIAKGNKASEVKTILNSIVNEYMRQLKLNYKKRYDTSNVYLKLNEKRSDILSKNLESYKKELNSGKLNSSEYEDLSNLISNSEADLSDTLETANKIGNNLVFFEKPKVLAVHVEKTKSYWSYSFFSFIDVT
jgi:hypothetical protein